MDALLRGVKDGQDILTLSLGGADGWTSSSAAVVASRIARSGKIVTIAAGNDVSGIHLRPAPHHLTRILTQRSDGSWYSSSPGNAIDAISVASVEKYAL